MGPAPLIALTTPGLEAMGRPRIDAAVAACFGLALLLLAAGAAFFLPVLFFVLTR